MISLGIERGGERQNVGGTELNAKSTPLAALNGNGSIALGHRGSPPRVWDLCTPAAITGKTI
jgi:hypothetical protein